jgi:D-serine deaminase-like pyridoxal phosphate-dependent protein
VFHDLAQTAIGSCGPERIAVALRCPVLAVYPERGELVVHGGAVHFSKDHLRLPNGTLCYGKVVRDTGSGWDTVETGLILTALSQEHGTVAGPREAIASFQPGDGVTILPVHSCLTADAMGAYTTLEGERIERL